MLLKAYAKINLSLKILGKRPDGFHEIESVMQSVSLCDNLVLTPLESGIQLTTNNLRLTTDNRNLAFKAAEVFLRTQNTGIKINIEKNIPLAAGLGGGSADAAAVLYGLNKMTNDAMTNDELMNLGSEIGSDVPFCLTGGNCTVKGRGEIVARNPFLSSRTYMLVVPDVEVSTQWAYKEFDGFISDSPQLIVGNTNHLEPIVIKKYPIIQKVKDKLLNLGCTFAQMSGSGPSVFGFPGNEKILAAMKKEFPRSFLVKSIERGVEERREKTLDRN